MAWHARVPRVCLLVACAGLTAESLMSVHAALRSSTDPRAAVSGAAIYETRCAACHGSTGRGDGPAAAYMSPRPRDFSKALFKFRHEPQRGFPSDAALYKLISRGFPAYGMPSFDYLSAQARWALVDHVKLLARERLRDRLVVAVEAAFAEGELDEEDREDELTEIEEFLDVKMRASAPVDLGSPPPPDEQTMARGNDYFKESCAPCHGLDGSGAGTEKPQPDDWGELIHPRNYKLGPLYLKDGFGARDIARKVLIGIPGTPMPASSKLSTDQAWAIAYHVQSLLGVEPGSGTAPWSPPERPTQRTDAAPTPTQPVPPPPVADTPTRPAGPQRATPTSPIEGTVVSTGSEDHAVLVGRVRFEGDPPAPRRFQTKDPCHCGTTDRLLADVMVSEAGGLQHAVVEIFGVQDAPAYSPEQMPRLVQEGCVFEPRVAMVAPGGEVEVINNDPVLHNVNSDLFNIAQPTKGQSDTLRLQTRRRGFIRVNCNVHSWMESWLYVPRSAFAVPVDSNGSFEIGALPPGDYKVVARHPTLGKRAARVALKEGQTVRWDISFTSR